MSQFKAGVAIYKNDTEVIVHTLKGSDSHTAIREAHGICDELGAGATRQTPIELIPVGKATLRRPDRQWELTFGAGRPSWWTDAHTKAARRQLSRAARDDWDGDILHHDGDLWLERISSLPAGVTVSATGDIFLGSLLTIPDRVTIRAGRDVYIGKVVEMSSRSKIIATGIYLRGQWQTRKEL